MPQKNALWVGLLLGLCIPLVGYALLLTIFEQLEFAGIFNRGAEFSPTFRRERTLSIVAICINVPVLNYYMRRRFFGHTVQGIVIATVVCVGIWVFKFWKYLF